MRFSPIFVLRKISIHIFLLSFIISFFAPSLYKTIVQVQFYVVAPIVILLNYNYRSLSQSAQLIFLIFTGLTIMTGVPGSAFGFAASASLGLFLSQNIPSTVEGNHRIDHHLFLFTALCFVVGSAHLIYSNLQNVFSFDQLGEYFGTASINYAAITVASLCSIFAAWAVKRQYYGPNFTPSQKKWARIFSGILAIAILGLSIIFSTRSAVLGFLAPLLYAIQPKKPYLYFGIMALVLVVIYFVFPIFSEFIISVMAPGRESLVDLYDSELKGQERSESAMQIYSKAIPYFSFCTTCSDYLSFSGISNLIALSFPFSIFFVVQILRYIYLYIKNFIVAKKSNSLFFLIIGLSFLNSILLAVFQADFLSMLSLFYVVGTGIVAAGQKLGDTSIISQAKLAL